MNLGHLEEVKDLRSVWSNEASDFTPWLAKEENIKRLSETLGIDIEVIEQESSVGGFNVDIFAVEEGTDKKIIIENQLEATNHDHLGKLITYASGKKAEILIWLVKEARDEHRSAVEWLNSNLGDEIGVFLCEIKLYKIGDSEPAVKFEIIERPNEWTKVMKKNEDLKPRHVFRLKYWTALNSYLSNDKVFLSNYKLRKPTKEHWMSWALGTSNCHLEGYTLKQKNELALSVYIRNNQEFFDYLYGYKDEIEKKANLSFEWMPMSEHKGSQIKITNRGFNLEDEATWEEQFKWISETAVKIKKAFSKYIKNF